MLQKSKFLKPSSINANPISTSTTCLFNSAKNESSETIKVPTLNLSSNFTNLTKTKIQLPTKSLDEKSKDISHSETIKSSDENKAPTFVFGKNLIDRVENLKADNLISSKADTLPPTFDSREIESNKITKELPELNQETAKIDSNINNENNETTQNDSKTLNLNESAQKYATFLNSTRKIEDSLLLDSQQAKLTGEENESTIFQVYGKLYEFDANLSLWNERGTGNLKLNETLPVREKANNENGLISDNQELKCRLIMRNMGNLRLILNTPVFAQMAPENPNSKSIRFLAHTEITPNANIDKSETQTSKPNKLGVFLLKGTNITDIANMTEALKHRIKKQQSETHHIKPTININHDETKSTQNTEIKHKGQGQNMSEILKQKTPTNVDHLDKTENSCLTLGNEKFIPIIKIETTEGNDNDELMTPQSNVSLEKSTVSDDNLNISPSKGTKRKCEEEES